MPDIKRPTHYIILRHPTDATKLVDVVTILGKNRVAVDASVSVAVEDFIGFDNFASTFFTITLAGGVGDTIKVEIDTPAIVSVTSILTATESGDVEAAATLVKNDLNADSSFNALFLAKTLDDKVFVIAKDVAEKGEFPNVSPDDFRVTVTGTTTVNIETDFNRITRRNKLILGEPDITDNRFVRLGIFGEVGSRTKAENPIFISIAKSLATGSEVILVDKNVDAEQTWFITSASLGNEHKSQMRIYKGLERDRQQFFSGDGVTKDFTLSAKAVPVASKITVKVDTILQSLGPDYIIIDDPNDDTKSIIRFDAGSIPPTETNNIDIIYDAVNRVSVILVQTDTTHQETWGAPLKLLSSLSQFIIATVQNGPSSSADASLNLNGFFEVD